MTSADFSPPWEISLGKLFACRLACAAFTSLRVRMTIGRPTSIAGLPHQGGLVCDFCSSNPTLAAGFFQTPPHGDALASGYSSGHHGLFGTCTLKPNNMPGTQRRERQVNRPAALGITVACC
jgi:hypothetical protein